MAQRALVRNLKIFNGFRSKSHSFVNRSFCTFNLEDVMSQKEKLLLTPGPLSVSQSVRNALLRDFGSRDESFISLVRSIRNDVLSIAQVDNNEYTCVLMQGSGTFAVEAAIGTIVPRGQQGKMLLVTNGSYGDRAVKIAKILNIPYTQLSYTEDTKPSITDIEKELSANASKNEPYSAVFMVHSETTSGLVNPIDAVGQIAHKYNANYIVDAMSSFGGIPIDFDESKIDVLVTSANKCVQGVPGFGIVIVKKALLEKCAENARSLSLDLYAQNKGLNENGQFRFTPPTHTIVAFKQAINELNEEGLLKRNERYLTNKKMVCDKMKSLGFELYLKEEDQGEIISSFKYPESDNWNFEMFYNKLAENDFLIYPGKVTNANCFRIGHIGAIFPKDMERFNQVMDKVCAEMKLFEKTQKE